MEIQQFYSVGTSVITGIVVAILVEFFVFISGRIKRKREIAYIREFFREVESEVKQVKGAEDGSFPRSQAQFVYFEAQLKVSQMIISARSTHLSREQSFAILKLVSQRLDFVRFISTNAKGRLPEDKFYNLFFRDLSELGWLKF